MTLDSALIEPFVTFAFMRRALAACVALSIGAAPLGFFMNHRRMALVSDAMSHAILPGVAVAFLIAGLGVWPLTIGGLVAGCFVALLSVFLTRHTKIKEDSVFMLLFLLSLTSGIVLLSLKGSNVDLLHMLFGDILAIDNEGLYFVSGVSIATLYALAFLYRRLVLDCFDPDFLMASGRGRGTRQIFFMLFVVNLVAAFQALGTLMALGLLLLPSLASGFWTRRVDTALALSVALGVFSSAAGLLVSYHTNTPSGPMVVMACGLVCLFSVLFGTRGSFVAGLRRR